MDDTAVRSDPKLLYRRLDGLFKEINRGQEEGDFLKSFLEEAFLTLGQQLCWKASLFYEERDDVYYLQQIAGTVGAELPQRLDALHLSLQPVLRQQVYIFDNPDAEESPSRQGLLPRAASAAILVGRRPHRSIFFYLLNPGWQREELEFSLNAIRAALGVRLLAERLRGSVKEAAAIQQSLLVEEPPAFEGYDIACNTIAAEEVGGDFYDFLPFSDQVGIAIGDASGHGLPAALLVRDVVTGLRMGVERHLKVAYVFEKLNRVIHRSMLSSRFVSLFYGELESTGNFIYVNAGHPPPLIFNGDTVESLDRGGSVIGPLPEVAFQRGITRIERGSVLLLCTDGILERCNPKGEYFGDCGLHQTIQSSRGLSAQHMLDRLFSAAFDFGSGKPWEDDATGVLVIRR
jgi:sigma-B regulation protein RsbU (phosphoserine phosphatase)